MRRALTALLGKVAVVALLASCATDADDPARTAGTPDATTPTGASSPGSTPDSTGTPAVDPTGSAPSPSTTALQTGEPLGDGGLVLTTVRVGAHEGFDRVVMEFTGDGAPGWAANYVDKARRDGSGEVVALAGDAFLDIYASGTTYPSPDATYYQGPRRIELANGGSLAEVFVSGTFEGYTQVLAGIDGGPAPFRVFALSDPARLVVDISDQDAG